MASQIFAAPSPASNRSFPISASTPTLIENGIDLDDDDDDNHPGYAKCTCVRYKSPSPPPPISTPIDGKTPESKRRLPPPPPPPLVLVYSEIIPQQDASKQIQNRRANPSPRSFENEPRQQSRKMSPDADEETGDAALESVVDDYRFYPTSVDNSKNGDQSQNADTCSKSENSESQNRLCQSPNGRLKTILRSTAEFDPAAESKFRWRDSKIEKERSRTRNKEYYRSRSISPPSTSSESGTKEDQTTKAKGSGSGKNKNIEEDPSKVRVSVFYTWSFSGQHRRRPRILHPAILPPPPPPPTAIAEPFVLSVNHFRSYSARPRLALPLAANMPSDYYSNKRSRSAYSTAPRNFNRVNGTASYNAKTLRPSQCYPSNQHGQYGCYSTIGDTPNVYRNIFPYTTLYRAANSYHQYPHQSSYHQGVSPRSAAYYNRYNDQQAAAAAELARSIRRQHRYHENASTQGNATGFDVFVTDTPYHHYNPGVSTVGNGGPPSASQVPMTSAGISSWSSAVEEQVSAANALGIEKIIDPASRDGDNESGVTTNNRCSSRACLIGWMLSLTAVIILALAVGLFIQISRESARFEQLQLKHDEPTATTQSWPNKQMTYAEDFHS